MARMLRTTLLCAAMTLTGALAAAAPAGAAPTKANWDRRAQGQVVRAGLMQNLPGGFHGDQPLTAGDLRVAFQALSAKTGTAAVQVSSAPIKMDRFDALVVAQLGLSDLARAVQQEARRAGLAPPARFGTEVVARQLGLRFNHPFPYEDLELYPWDRITRAEAAFSLARVLSFSGWEAQYARDVLGRFQLPSYSPAERRALHVAASKIGMPYVWGGETDWPSPGQVHGGYDCSGFAWRVYKLSGDPAGRRIRGRTAAQQAGEIPKSQRIRFEDIRPGDLLFFGSAGFRSRATEANVVHMGIAMSKDFMIHSSSEGVYVSPLFDDWRRNEFTWARHLL